MAKSHILSLYMYVHVDSSGIGNAESALPLKSIGLSSSSHSDPCPMELHRPRQQLSQDRVRRSRRLVERSAKIKNETTDTTSQRYVQYICITIICYAMKGGVQGFLIPWVDLPFLPRISKMHVDNVLIYMY